MIDLLKRHEIQVLRRAGHSLPDVAKLAGVSVSSVQRVEREPGVSHVDNVAERIQRRVGRPSKVESFRGLVVEQLAKEPELLSLEILRRARLAGYGGGKTALYDLIHSMRPRPSRLLTRFEGLPGEFSQHDFGEVDVCFLDGSKERVHFFASRLKYSRWTEVSLVDDETVDLLRQLREWLQEVNTERPSRATRVIPAERMREERPRLRPLKVTPTELALRIPITVGPTGVVVHDTHEYSMPPDSMGIPGTLYLYRDKVRIVAGRFESVHTRLFGPPAKSTLPEHRAQRVAAVAGKRAKRYMQRQHLLEIGPSTLEYLTELTHRRTRVWVRDVDRLHDLLQRHGQQALRAAFERGLAECAFGAEYIAHYLALTPDPMPCGAEQQELPL